MTIGRDEEVPEYLPPLKLEKPPRREMIDHPQHYGGDTVYEVIKVLEAWELNFHLGNAVKYIARAGKKGSALEDLQKAVWYLNREIERRVKSA
jgi:hypothetical protein